MTPTHAEPLVFPRGVWFPTIAELPEGSSSDAPARISEASATRFTTGYVVKQPTRPGWTAIIEANVHAPDLWPVFTDLVNALLPAAAAPLLCIKGEIPMLGDYTTRDAALAVLAPYSDLLCNDGFLEFGCMFQRAGQTEEVFVPAAKFIRVWTNTPDRVVAVLESRGIPGVPDLRFIDEFPLVSQTLPLGAEQCGWHAVQEALRVKFRDLPDPPDIDAQA